MRVLLDRERCETDCDSVGEAIAGAAVIAERNGRVVIEVVVDGSTWGEQELASPELNAVAAEEIRLTTANLRDLVRETLDDAGAALIHADSRQREAAEHLQANRSVEAMEKLDEALSIWHAVQQAVLQTARAVSLDLDALAIDSSIETLGRHLGTIRSALERKDPVGLSDTLLYELPAVVTEWRQLIETVGTAIGETPKTDRASDDETGDA